MTLFEYLAIAFSFLFSFSALRLVGGLPHAVQVDRRYWIHLCFVSVQLLATVGVFWNFWAFRDITWTFPTFLLVLASPGLIYYNACALIPENPSAVESWRSYYYSVSTRYFAGVACWSLLTVCITTAVLEMPFVHPTRAAQAAIFALAVAGAASARERVHTIVVFLFLLIGLFGMLTLGFRAGGFAES